MKGELIRFGAIEKAEPAFILAKEKFVSGTSFWIELFFALMVVILCFLIYKKTKEIYDLTSHKGIKYFRQAFLFFGVAFLSRFLLMLSIILNDGPLFGKGLFQLGFFIFIYSGLMAALLLVYSTIWNKFKDPDRYFYWINLIALSIALVDTIFNPRENFFFIITLLLLISTIISFSSRESNKTLKTYVIYIFLFLAWFSSILANFFVRFSTLSGIILYVISALLFLLIYTKVNKSLSTK